MFELTCTTVPGFLRRHGYSAIRSVNELSGGVSNVVFRVEADGRVFVLKQSRAQLRTQAAWFSDLSRIYREIDVMQALHPVLPNVVPEVLFRDDENYAFAMTHAPEPCRDWRSVLLAGEVDPDLGGRAGIILAKMHNVRFDGASKARFKDRTVFRQLRTDPFYRAIQARYPDLERIDGLIHFVEKDGCSTLCHGDYSPKNLLLHDRDFFLVDYETAHLGPPMYDVGFFVSHLILKALHRPAMFEAYAATIRSFERAYHELHPTTLIKPDEGLELGHAAGCLLARVDGTSPAPYLTNERKRESARWLARQFLRQSSEWDNWDWMLSLVEGECRSLAHADSSEPQA